MRDALLSFNVDEDDQGSAKTWLAEYFEVQGDHDPESGEIMLQISLNEEAYAIWNIVVATDVIWNIVVATASA